MGRINVKRFNAPDETRSFPRGQAALLKFGTDVVGLASFEAGWKWSKDVMPLAGTQSCKAAHSCYVLSGRMRIVMDDSEAVAVSAGDFAPSHPARRVGAGQRDLPDGGLHRARALRPARRPRPHGGGAPRGAPPLRPPARGPGGRPAERGTGSPRGGDFSPSPRGDCCKSPGPSP